jgi:hypothetical protein
VSKFGQRTNGLVEGISLRHPRFQHKGRLLCIGLVAFLQQLIVHVDPWRVRVFITYDGGIDEMADFLNGYDI